jgi:tripartite-type tricarboxylate transporter receptor subunit TctC
LTLAVAVPPGGALDFIARLLSREMSASLGQPIIVENNPGAGGTLGTNKAMKAPADGYTMMLSSPTEVILAPLNYNAAQYKAEDLRTIRIVGHTGLMVVVRKGLAAGNLAELVALMKANADKPLTFCSPGNGSLYHLVAEKLSATGGVKSVYVPYSGFPQCMTDLIGGNVDFAVLPLAGPFPGAVDSGGIRAIAMLSNVPSTRLPKVPLASATKGFEGFAFSVWSAVHVNGKVPDAVAELLNQHVNAALAKPEVAHRDRAVRSGRVAVNDAQAGAGRVPKGSRALYRHVQGDRAVQTVSSRLMARHADAISLECMDLVSPCRATGPFARATCSSAPRPPRGHRRQWRCQGQVPDIPR